MITKLVCKYLDRGNKGYVTYGDIFVGLLIVLITTIIALGVTFLLGFAAIYHQAPCASWEYNQIDSHSLVQHNDCTSIMVPDDWIMQSMYYGIMILGSVALIIFVIIFIIRPLLTYLIDKFVGLCNKKAVECPRRKEQ